MCVLHHRPICRMNGRSIKWLKEVRKNNMPVNGMLTELTIRHWKEYMLNIVKLISMVRHNGSWSFIITFFQLSLLVSILSFMMWSDEPGRIIPKNCKSYAQNAQNPRKTLLWMDSTYELPIKRVTHTLSIQVSDFAKKPWHKFQPWPKNFSMDFILQSQGVSDPVPQDMHLLQLNPLKWVLPRFSGEPPGCFPLPFAPSCGLVGAVMELLTQKSMGVVDGQSIEKNGPFRMFFGVQEFSEKQVSCTRNMKLKPSQEPEMIIVIVLEIETGNVDSSSESGFHQCLGYDQ